MKPKIAFLFFLLLSGLLMLNGCGNTKEATDGKGQKNDQEQMKKGTIVNRSGLDGCGFLIELENGKQFIPDNLQEQFMEDGMKVLFSYKEIDRMTTCMAGKSVEIIQMKRKE